MLIITDSTNPEQSGISCSARKNGNNLAIVLDPVNLINEFKAISDHLNIKDSIVIKVSCAKVEVTLDFPLSQAEEAILFINDMSAKLNLIDKGSAAIHDIQLINKNFGVCGLRMW